MEHDLAKCKSIDGKQMFSSVPACLCSDLVDVHELLLGRSAKCSTLAEDVEWQGVA